LDVLRGEADLVRYLYRNVLNFRLEALMGSVSLRLSEELKARLSRLSERTGRSKTFYMIEAIEEHIGDLEALYLAEERLIRHREGLSKAYTQEEMEARYGLAD
jgi:RHH-type rel operon transcriptional repressor/antitoxin RelB